MKDRYLYTVQGETSGAQKRAVVTLDLDALVDLDGQGASHPGKAKNYVYETTSLRDFVRKGWAEGAERANALSTVLAGEVPAVQSIRRRWEWGNEGETLDADRALAGDWDVAYQRSVRRCTSGQVITTIAAQFGGRSHRTATELFWTGAQLVAAADVLEAAGYKVEAHAINVARYNYHDSNNHVGILDLVVKRPEDPMRTDLLMAATANDRVYRSFGFLGKCYFPLEYDVSNMGYTVDENATAAREFLREVTDLGMMPEIENWMPHAYTREQAVNNVLAVLHAVTGRTE